MCIWLSGRSRSPDFMDPVRTLFFVAANNNFHVVIRHISGIDNSIADALSRLQLSRFRALAPHADPYPCGTDIHLTTRLNKLQAAGVAASTRRTYRAGTSAYSAFLSCQLQSSLCATSVPISARQYRTRPSRGTLLGSGCST